MAKKEAPMDENEKKREVVARQITAGIVFLAILFFVLTLMLNTREYNATTLPPTPQMTATDTDRDAIATPYGGFLIPLDGGPALYPPPPPISTISPEDALKEVDRQLKESFSANIAFNTPDSMILDQRKTIILLLNPSLSQEALRTQVVQSLGIPGSQVTVQTANIEITDLVKAVLLSTEEGAFDIARLHDNEIQPVSAVETTQWSWDVTPKMAGTHTLAVVVYRLVKVNGQDYWRETETYRRDIAVRVTPVQRLALVGKTGLGIIVAVITALAIEISRRMLDARKKGQVRTPPPARRYRSR